MTVGHTLQGLRRGADPDFGGHRRGLPPLMGISERIMSTIPGIALPAGAGAVARAAGAAMTRWWAAYMTWRIERLAISRLSAMSDSQLEDIGILRSQIEVAVKRW